MSDSSPLYLHRTTRYRYLGANLDDKGSIEQSIGTKLSAINAAGQLIRINAAMRKASVQLNLQVFRSQALSAADFLLGTLQPKDAGMHKLL